MRASPCHLHLTLLNFIHRKLIPIRNTHHHLLQISLFGRLHGGDKNPLQTQSIFELPHHTKRVYVNPRLLEKTVSSKYRRPAPLPHPHDFARLGPRSYPRTSMYLRWILSRKHHLNASHLVHSTGA